MKHINSDTLISAIDKIIKGLKNNCSPNPLGGTMEECLAAAQIEALEMVKEIITEKSETI